MKSLITAERLREVLHYDPETGIMTWLVNQGRAFAGDVAGCPNADGHLRVKIDGRLYYIHRLAVLYMTGVWPPRLVDHRNRDRADNRWENLRPASTSQNGMNRDPPKNNTSGFKGVSWDVKAARWQANLCAAGVQRNLGRFDTMEEARVAYAAAAAELHGEFARAG